ncbi:MAG: hypothetical protein RMJ67_06670 [Elusimicrobiota bacterium]|nr:hypothetical protein [Endomicrobiia bacterium]MDW8166177.1 hypothetical protein [Elusimicrobiota bacterium]
MIDIIVVKNKDSKKELCVEIFLFIPINDIIKDSNKIKFPNKPPVLVL